MDESDPKKFLEELKEEKELIEKYIKQLQESIKDNETKYLQNTSNGGNILRGWEHIFTSKANKMNMGNPVKKTHISNNEKLFSQTFDFDKINDELLNHNEKHHNQSQSVSVNNSNTNLKLEENNNKNINTSVNMSNMSNMSNINMNGTMNKNNAINKRKKYLNKKRNAEANINNKQET